MVSKDKGKQKNDLNVSIRNKSLSYDEVSQGFKKLLKHAQKFRPDMIFGINRGGAIVGGYLAKQLELPTVTLLNVNLELPGREKVVEQRSPRTPIYGRVLLVDDAARTGRHMAEACEYLKYHYPSAKVQCVVLLRLELQSRGPEQRSFRYPSFDKVGVLSNDSHVKLPWDP